MNYSPSTIAVASELAMGLRSETSTLNNATYLLTGGTDTACFNIIGRIWVKQLYLEAITAFSANATQIAFFFDASTPAVASNLMCAKCASVSGLGAGQRVVWVGGAVATAAVITDSAGLSDVCATAPQLVGMYGGVGTLGVQTSDASQASGTFRVVMHWAAGSDGAYAEAAL